MSNRNQGVVSNTDSASGLGFNWVDGTYNEAFSQPSKIRAHWQPIIESLQSMGQDQIALRHEKVQHILRDDGATYQVYNNTDTSQTWALDPIPYILESEEWRNIESGLIERAELFNLILKDLYGPQELIKHRIIPPELLYSHPAFLRPCYGIALNGENHLVIHSADMLRDQNGEMLVIGDRTQAPSGSGYALENRVVMGRVFPSLFRESHVHRLSNFFNTLRHTLNHLCPQSELPQVVVLTPGAYNETHFEHAHLSNYLGFPLVQGIDLTVRDGYVWMKTLSGLVRVDVILRRVDDAFCDPVELKSQSQLGVPGLLDVIRRGNVTLANPLGSGILETPSLLKYLPDISKALLGRELRLKSPKTLWCGDPKDLNRLLQEFDQWIVKPCYRSGPRTTISVQSLTLKQKEELKQQIQQSPFHFTAQQIHRPSMLPSWNNNGLVVRPAVLRSFTISEGNSYMTMPGGLTRVGTEADTLVITNQTGSCSKDTWIITSEPKIFVDRPMRDVLAAGETPPETDLTSRVVENMFWMGRYAERAESSLRLLRTIFTTSDSDDELPSEVYQQLLLAITKITATYPGFTQIDPDLLNHPEQELKSIILDANRVGSVHSSLQAMITSADEIKEMMSTDVIGIINDLRDELIRLEYSLNNTMNSAPEEVLDPLVTDLMAISGVMHESMVRTLGWRFFDMGRRLERALQTCILLRATLIKTLPPDEQSILLENVLICLESNMTYRRRYRARLDMTYGLEFTILDRSNPRSLIFQLETLVEHSEKILGLEQRQVLPKWSKYLLDVMTAVRSCDPAELSVTDTRASSNNNELDAEANAPKALGSRIALEQLLARSQEQLLKTSDTISDRYFDHSDSPQILNNGRWDLE